MNCEFPTIRVPSNILMLAAACFTAAGAAQELPTILRVDVDNYVAYLGDVTDPARVARSAGPVMPTAPVNFTTIITLADVVGVNDAPAKGTMVIRSQTLRLTPTPTPGAAIADVTRAAYGQLSWEFLNADGSVLGTIYGMSLSGGTPSPGSPADADGGTAAIVGGTGAFIGAKGTINPVEIVNPRSTSQAEDPSMRRTNGGGRARFVFQVFPMLRPEVVMTATSGIFHADKSFVTQTNPARPGEELTLFARGIAPASNIEVLINEQLLSPIEAAKTSGTTGNYRVKFRVPEDTETGLMTLQLKAGWMKGSPLEIPIR